MLLTDEIGGDVCAVGKVKFHQPVIMVRDLEHDQTGAVTFLQIPPLQGG